MYPLQKLLVLTPNLEIPILKEIFLAHFPR